MTQLFLAVAHTAVGLDAVMIHPTWTVLVAAGMVAEAWGETD